jgi:hypothetical protein
VSTRRPRPSLSDQNGHRKLTCQDHFAHRPAPLRTRLHDGWSRCLADVPQVMSGPGGWCALPGTQPARRSQARLANAVVFPLTTTIASSDAKQAVVATCEDARRYVRPAVQWQRLLEGSVGLVRFSGLDPCVDLRCRCPAGDGISPRRCSWDRARLRPASPARLFCQSRCRRGVPGRRRQAGRSRPPRHVRCRPVGCRPALHGT